MAKWPWAERRFTFDFPVGKFPDILGRLRGAPARVEDVVRGLSADVVTRRDRPERWSIQENIGHLLDLDPLLDGRLDDLLAERETLRAADMSNAATRQADHNARDLGDLLREFRAVRERLCARLESMTDEQLALAAMHPRLEQPFRMVDAACFHAEHDDDHIARMWELRRMFS